MEDFSREMTLGEHLEELRRYVIRALYFLGGAVVVALFFQEPLMRLVVWPHTKTMRALLEEKKPEKEWVELQKLLPKLKQLSPQSEREKLYQKTLLLLIHHLKTQQKKWRESATKLKLLRYQSGFIAYLKVCFIVGLFFGAPFALYQLWLFVSEGLYEHEKRAIRFYAPFSYLAFFLGVAFGYFILIPVGLRYLSTFASPDIAENFISMDWYLSLFFALTIALGLLFELPLVMLLLSRLGIFEPSQYISYWKYWILLAFTLSAFLTPPDPFTQILLAFPVCGLYGVGILLAKWFGKKKEEEEESFFREEVLR